MSKRYNIVCLSSQFYRRRDDLWTNKQHIMSRLSERYRVLYVNPPSCYSVRRCVRSKSLLPLLEKESDNLWVYWSYQITSREFGRNWKLNRWINSALLKHYIKKLGMQENLILWVYYPELAYFAGRLGERFVLYDCVDILSAFPRYDHTSLKADIVAKEESLVREADLVIATTDVIYRDKKGLNRNTYCVPNVGDFEHFSTARSAELEVSPDVARLKKPVVGFIGAVTDYKLDIPLLEEVARVRPGWSIVLVGPIVEPCGQVNTSSLRERENVHLLGKVPYEHLPAYVKAFDVCIIPYALNEYTRGVFPIKFFEYMATGKPIASTPLPSLLGYKDLVHFGEDTGAFVDAIEKALREKDDVLLQRRIETARHNSWESRIGKIMDHIERHWPREGRG